MNQLYYYMIKGMVSGRVKLESTSRAEFRAYHPYVEHTHTLAKDGAVLGASFGRDNAIPYINLYGTFLDLRPLIKVRNKLEEIAKKKADKEFMKDLLAYLTKTETYRNE